MTSFPQILVESEIEPGDKVAQHLVIEAARKLGRVDHIELERGKASETVRIIVASPTHKEETAWTRSN